MTLEQLCRKCDQEWEMAGLARQDGDTVGEQLHVKKAQEYEKLIKEALS